MNADPKSPKFRAVLRSIKEGHDSVGTIARHTGLSHVEVRNAVRFLNEWGYLDLDLDLPEE